MKKIRKKGTDSDWTRGNGFKISEGRLKLDIRKMSFTVKMVKHWNNSLWLYRRNAPNSFLAQVFFFFLRELKEIEFKMHLVL